MDSPSITHLSLCSGYGGIDLGLKRSIPKLRTIAYAEIEAFACEVLLARMEGGQLDAAPIWSDLKSFPWSKFRGLVDILSGGYPCQPFSGAGLRRGKDDQRHLWPWIADGIELMRPRLCFFENVEGHISMGLSDVIEDLVRMGYRVSWGVFSAAEVGACHCRKRVFLLASDSLCKRGQLQAEWIKPTVEDVGGNGTARRTQDGWECLYCGQDVFSGCSCDHNELRCHKCGEWTYPFHYSIKDGCLHCGSEFPRWNDISTWPIEPTVRRGNDGTANRVDRLRLLGNGVVPATAEKAFRVLLEKLQHNTQ